MAHWLDVIIQKFLLLIDTGGYPVVFLLSFIDRAAMNLAPAEVILPFFGFLIYQGKLNFLPVMIAVTGGGLLGDIVLFWLSRKGGRWFLERYGKYILISRHELEHTDRLFAKHGGKLVLFGRLLPPVRTFIAIPAGISNMGLGKFSVYTILGSLPWSLLLIYLGVRAGENWGFFMTILGRIDLLATAGLVILIAWYLLRHFQKKHFSHEA
ncbi:MAG: DedA family protein [Parcubacteria group bacterium]|nr:DedA family protein [Parcubacteria group bacterium]